MKKSISVILAFMLLLTFAYPALAVEAKDDAYVQCQLNKLLELQDKYGFVCEMGNSKSDAAMYLTDEVLYEMEQFFMKVRAPRPSYPKKIVYLTSDQVTKSDEWHRATISEDFNYGGGITEREFTWRWKERVSGKVLTIYDHETTGADLIGPTALDCTYQGGIVSVENNNSSLVSMTPEVDVSVTLTIQFGPFPAYISFPETWVSSTMYMVSAW